MKIETEDDSCLLAVVCFGYFLEMILEAPQLWNCPISVFLCLRTDEQKLLFLFVGIFKITSLANHIRDGFRKQQVILILLPIIELATTA